MDAPADRQIRERVFPWLDPRWIVYEDDALIAIDKPPGVSTQAAREGAEDDLPTRVKRFLETRDGTEDAYVGTHQRIDKETSGLVVYAKARAANASLATQMESRSVEKVYLAVVEGWRGPTQTTLRSRLAEGDDGKSVVARDGKLAITHVRMLARNGERALLEARIETGRTHQIRAQVAHAGAPIAGDRLYGGAPAPRLMLHATRMTLEHPIDGSPLALEAKAPRVLDRWLEGRPTELEDALAIAVQRRFALGRAAMREHAKTTAFRLVHDGDAIPGAAVDVYGDWLVLHAYGEREREAEIADALDALGFAGVYVKRRPKQSNEIDDDVRAELAPTAPIRGAAAPDEFVILEDGVPFLVRLGDGMSTGLFLDQRENRARVRAMAPGARVLNLFAYTCGFSVAAVAGGARETVSVDASGAALDRGRANLTLSGAEPASHRTVRADVFEWLERAAKRGEKFDLVCCDPPTYSTTKKSRWTSGASWRRLAALCLDVLSPGGALLATTNDRRLPHGAFRQHVRDAARDRTVTLASLRDLALPEEWRPAQGSEPHMLGVLAIASR